MEEAKRLQRYLNPTRDTGVDTVYGMPELLVAGACEAWSPTTLDVS
jgi:hypothetical protein